MIPILCCSVNQRCLPVLEVSLKTYCPEAPFVCDSKPAGNFGESYNRVMREAFDRFEDATGVLIVNDDVVFGPSTYRLLCEDFSQVSTRGPVGLLGARSDNAAGLQNIRYSEPDDRIVFLRWASERRILRTVFVAAMCCVVSREAFAAAQFEPIDYYSDNLLCEDLSKLGFRHYISRAYVHHVGQQTTGETQEEMMSMDRKGLEWLRTNRPDVYERLRGDR